MESWLLLLLLAVCYIIYHYCFKGLNHFKEHRIYHISPWPLLGNMWPLFLRKLSLTEIVKKMYDLSPSAKYVGLFDAMDPVVMIRDPELIKFIAVKNFDTFHDHHSFFNEINEPLFGKNLFSLVGEKWRYVKPLLSSTFTTNKMKTMFKEISECAINLTEFLAKTSESNNIMEMKEHFTKYTNDAIVKCAFGISVDSTKDPKNDFYVSGRDLADFNLNRTLKFYIVRSMPLLANILGMQIVSDYVALFLKDTVKNTIYNRVTHNIMRQDMLQLMIDSRSKGIPGKELTIKDMISQAFFFFFAGFEPTSRLMCFTAHEIAVNPDIQTKLRDEIDSMMEATNGILTYEDVNGMRYLDAVIKESLRMYPLSVVVNRVCLRDFELPSALPGEKPYVLKKGSTVWFPVYGLHRDPKYFKDPERFCPERFLNEGKTGINKDAYLPFGLGPRMCIGNRFALLEAKVILVHLLARCELKRCEKTVYPMRFSRNNFNITADGGFWIEVQRRNDSPNLSSNTDNDSSLSG